MEGHGGHLAFWDDEEEAIETQDETQAIKEVEDLLFSDDEMFVGDDLQLICNTDDDDEQSRKQTVV